MSDSASVESMCHLSSQPFAVSILTKADSGPFLGQSFQTPDSCIYWEYGLGYRQLVFGPELRSRAVWTQSEEGKQEGHRTVDEEAPKKERLELSAGDDGWNR